MRLSAAAAALLIFSPTLGLAEGEVRDLSAHEHGSGSLNIAVEGTQVAMELEAPGADIVGFEYAATTDEDRAKIDTAIADLARPLNLFVLPSAAECNVVEASVMLLGEEDHDEHDHEDEHAHDEHAEDDHADHDHEGEDHAEADHDAHDHDDHEGEDHAEHDHDTEASDAEHTEFHAEYMFDCANPAAIDKIEFVYFERFPNALELDLQLVSDAGANSFEVERDSPVLDLRGMF